MALSRDQHRLLYQIAQAYYIDGHTQQQIAKTFGLSRPKVSRLLKLARERKIVNITFNPPSGGLTDLERELKQKYGLDEVVAVPVSDPFNPATEAHELGHAAAEILLRRITGHEIVSLAWGTTVMALVDALPYKSIPLPDLTIVQMCGGLGPIEKLENSIVLAQRMARKFNANLRILSAPGIVTDREEAKALKSVKQIAETLDLAAHAHIAIVGMGSLTSSSYWVRDGSLLSQEDFVTLKKAGAVGDIALHFIDSEGHMLDLEINERIISPTSGQLRNIPMVIAIAGGPEKYEIIRAGLLSKIPKILVTDELTAEKLCQDECPEFM